MKFTTLSIFVSSLALLLLAACGTTVDRSLREDGGSTLLPPVADLQIEPPSGEYFVPFMATVTTATPNALIYCTLDGSDPTMNSTQVWHSISITQTVILRCRGYADQHLPSDIAERFYLAKNGGGGDNFGVVEIDVEIGVDGEEIFRQENGFLNLIHQNGQRPENPLVRITPYGEATRTVDPWVLDPFHAEEGISCDFSGNACVSAPLDLQVPELTQSTFAIIPTFSLVRTVGRGSVYMNSDGEVVVQDEPDRWSGYWFSFQIWYAKPEGE